VVGTHDTIPPARAHAMTPQPERATPERVLNWIGGAERAASSDAWFTKTRPTDGTPLCTVARSARADVNDAVAAATAAQRAWADTPAVERGMRLLRVVRAMQDHQQLIARVVAEETGKSVRDAMGETGGAIQLGLFFASEGQRLYGRTTTSGLAHKQAMTLRQPIGVAGLIVPANTPIANLAWKTFPALICGNAAVVKAAETAPGTAAVFARLAHDAGLTDGVLNVVQGFGEEAGAPLVEHPGVGVISFTGSTAVGRRIQRIAGDRFARVSLELGGKNAFVVCDDADLANAVKWALLSAFSNAGQRCASGSRLIVFDSVYDEFRDRLVAGARALRCGPADTDDYGPVITEGALQAMLDAIERARTAGANILTGGHRLTDDEHRAGYYLAPTLVEGVGPHDEFSVKELFGPIAALYRVGGYADAIALANDSPYGLTAAIHTRSVHRAMRFTHDVHAGVAVVNAGTFGSEPHMPFGGVKQSGNGSREPGTEALDVYSYLKNVFITTDPAAL
jgi:alpha-ketoglutaric semialdehyde dehydrogenase